MQRNLQTLNNVIAETHMSTSAEIYPVSTCEVLQHNVERIFQKSAIANKNTESHAAAKYVY